MTSARKYRTEKQKKDEEKNRQVRKTRNRGVRGRELTSTRAKTPDPVWNRIYLSSVEVASEHATRWLGLYLRTSRGLQAYSRNLTPVLLVFCSPYFSDLKGVLLGSMRALF
jgi:hypothetical protein